MANFKVVIREGAVMKRESTSLSRLSRIVRAAQLLFVLVQLVIVPTAMAGKYPYAEFKDTVDYEALEILKKHGVPVAHDRESPWFAISGVPGSYTIWLYQSDEIPQPAVLEIVNLCMDFYEQRGREERFRIVMYRESQEEWRKSLFLGIGALAGIKPYFELTIGRKR
ncbi:hypothetical protein SR882_08535 [Guyparkeria halophila]|uniref:Uncharacterized protein n=1 Tax=Guyparkeria halophila TaxID=47960 RepID=A0ABZ0YUX2_9GAMM|nr:hypothetical protein [Guyparkeria halophila]WQH15803.1 hypothetical protein SR882_08535 [Guyparkeria halophila]